MIPHIHQPQSLNRALEGTDPGGGGARGQGLGGGGSGSHGETGGVEPLRSHLVITPKRRSSATTRLWSGQMQEAGDMGSRIQDLASPGVGDRGGGSHNRSARVHIRRGA